MAADAMAPIEIFIQGEGISKIILVKMDSQDTVRDIIKVAREHGLSTPEGSEVFVLVENTEVPLDLDAKLGEVGLGPRSRVHIHSCQSVEVVVNFNGDDRKGFFPPSATVDYVKAWAVGKDGYDLSAVDASEHVLQVCNSTDRPDEDIHIGTLVKFSAGTLCFDLFAKQRVEG